MGFFSWKTSDTNQSIPNVYSTRKPFRVYLITEDEQIFKETEYEGYGMFGGKDFYELVAELNGKAIGDTEIDRITGIDICFKDNPCGDFNGKFKYPKIVEDLEFRHPTWKEYWDSLEYPETCEYQGFFYDDDDEFYDDDDDEFYDDDDDE